MEGTQETQGAQTMQATPVRRAGHHGAGECRARAASKVILSASPRPAGGISSFARQRPSPILEGPASLVSEDIAVLIDPSPLHVYMERIRREVAEGKPVDAAQVVAETQRTPGGQPLAPWTMDEPRQPDTPEHSRGTYTPVADEQLRVDYQLGPLMSRHIYRGSSPPLHVSTWA